MISGTGFAAVPTYFRGLLSPYEVAVWTALMWRHGADGSIFPSHDRIAKDACMSRRKVVTTLQSLRDKGLVTWETVQRPNGAVTSNRYTVHLRPPVQDVHTPCAPETHEVDTGEPDALSEDHGSALIDEQTSSGPRNRGTNVFDVPSLAAALDGDDEACGFLANHNWCGGTEELVEAALAELKANDAINDEGAYLGAALKRMSPVRKAARLLELVGAEDD